MNALCAAACYLHENPLANALSAVTGLGVSLYGLRKMTNEGPNLKNTGMLVAGAALSVFSISSHFMPTQATVAKTIIERVITDVLTNLEGLSTVKGLKLDCTTVGTMEGVLANCFALVPKEIIIGENFGRNESTICTIIKHMSSYVMSSSAPGEPISCGVSFTFCVR
jgi:hypothetical protein